VATKVKRNQSRKVKVDHFPPIERKTKKFSGRRLSMLTRRHTGSRKGSAHQEWTPSSPMEKPVSGKGREPPDLVGKKKHWLHQDRKLLRDQDGIGGEQPKIDLRICKARIYLHQNAIKTIIDQSPDMEKAFKRREAWSPSQERKIPPPKK